MTKSYSTEDYHVIEINLSWKFIIYLCVFVLGIYFADNFRSLVNIEEVNKLQIVVKNQQELLNNYQEQINYNQVFSYFNSTNYLSKDVKKNNKSIKKTPKKYLVHKMKNNNLNKISKRDKDLYEAYRILNKYFNNIKS